MDNLQRSRRILPRNRKIDFNSTIVAKQKNRDFDRNKRRDRIHSRLLLDAKKIKNLQGQKQMKKNILAKIRLDLPDLDLFAYYETYLKASNSFDYFENETLEVIEDNFGRGKRRAKRVKRRLARAVKKGKSKKVKKLKALDKYIKTGDKGDLKKIRKDKLKKITKGITNALLAPLLAPLLPFRKPMLKAIDKKTGRNMKKSKFLDIIKTFNKVILKRNNFESNLEKFETELDYRNYYGENFQDHIISDSISGIIKGILEFFKKLKDKKAKGEKITDGIVDDLANAAVSVNNSVKNLVNKDKGVPYDESTVEADLSVVDGVAGIDVTEGKVSKSNNSGMIDASIAPEPPLPTPPTKKDNTTMLIVGGALALFLIMGKK